MTRVGNIEVEDLFSGTVLNSWLRGLEEGALIRRVQKASEEDVKGADPLVLARQIVRAVVGSVPRLDRGQIAFGKADEGSPRTGWWIVRYDVPFVGDRTFFDFAEWSRPFTPPARVRDGQLRLYYQTNGFGTDERFESELALIEEVLDRHRQQLDAWLDRYVPKVAEAVEERQAFFSAQEAQLRGSAYALRQRADAPQVFQAVTIKEVVKPTLEMVAPLEPEPYLLEEQYQHILGLINQMGRVVELAPTAFKDMDEESLRFVLLVPLNSHFEGEAKAEAFSNKGKTDIHIQHRGASIFIAECKVWKGPQAYTEAIDQLLGYVTIRDTKTALIVFNRTSNATDRLESILAATKAHPNFERHEGNPSSMMQRYTLRTKDDPRRTFTMTVVLFNVTP